MATSLLRRKITAEEFVEFDLLDGRYELEDGLVYGMTGGSPAHSRVQANLLIALGNKLRGTGCRAYGSDMALKTLAHTVRYPDVTVYCGQPASEEQERGKFLPDPRAVFEVLSPSTRTLDEGRKVEEYQSLPSVELVCLVDPIAETVTMYHRNQAGRWDDADAAAAGDLLLPWIGITIPKDEIFARD